MSCLRDFLRDEKGSVTIEFILWIPLIMALVALVIDATTIYVTQTEMWNVARDTARRMVQGMTEAEAKDYAYATMSLREAPYDIQVNCDKDNNVAQVTISVGVEETTIIGSWSLTNPLKLIGGDMRANVVMRPHPAKSLKCETKT